MAMRLLGFTYTTKTNTSITKVTLVSTEVTTGQSIAELVVGEPGVQPGPFDDLVARPNYLSLSLCCYVFCSSNAWAS